MTPSEEAFAEELIAYWLSFVRAYDPSEFKLERSPSWPKYTAQSLNRIVLQRPKGADVNSTTVTVDATFMAAADDLFSLFTDEKRIPMWTRNAAKVCG